MVSQLLKITRADLDSDIRSWYLNHQDIIKEFGHFHDDIYKVDIDARHLGESGVKDMEEWLQSNCQKGEVVSDHGLATYWFRSYELALQFYLVWGTAFS